MRRRRTPALPRPFLVYRGTIQLDERRENTEETKTGSTDRDNRDGLKMGFRALRLLHRDVSRQRSNDQRGTASVQFDEHERHERAF